MPANSVSRTDKLLFIAQMGSKALFLSSARKGRKEADVGEALTAKPIGTSFMNHHISPGFEPSELSCALQHPPYVSLPA